MIKRELLLLLVCTENIGQIRIGRDGLVCKGWFDGEIGGGDGGRGVGGEGVPKDAAKKYAVIERGSVCVRFENGGWLIS